MQKMLTILVLCFIWTQAFCQSQRKFSTYLLAQYNKTIRDRTVGNNPWGAGLGLQTFLNHEKRFNPTIDLTCDIYLENDKVLRLNDDGSLPTKENDVRGMINLFLGTSFNATQKVYLSIVAGPSYTGSQIMLGIKPSIGFYFSKSRKWTGKASYINIFNRDQASKEDFSSVSLAIGVSLF